MANKPKKTDWIWEHNNGVQAVALDTERNRLLWYDNPGCGCGDANFEQSIENFLQRGAIYADPPEDVVAEMRETLSELMAN